MTTGQSDWDEHVALACLRFNKRRHTATDSTPFQAMFGIDAFEAWSEVELGGTDEEPESLGESLATLHKKLLLHRRKSRSYGKTQYDKAVSETQYQIGDRILMWSSKIDKDEGKKVVRP